MPVAHDPGEEGDRRAKREMDGRRQKREMDGGDAGDGGDAFEALGLRGGGGGAERGLGRAPLASETNDCEDDHESRIVRVVSVSRDARHASSPLNQSLLQSSNGYSSSIISTCRSLSSKRSSPRGRPWRSRSLAPSTDRLQGAAHDAAEHLAVAEVPVSSSGSSTPNPPGVRLQDDATLRLVLVPTLRARAHAEEHAQTNLRDGVDHVSEIAAPLDVGLGEEVLDEAAPDGVSHGVQLLVRLLHAILVVVQHLAHDRAVRQGEEFGVLWSGGERQGARDASDEKDAKRADDAHDRNAGNAENVVRGASKDAPLFRWPATPPGPPVRGSGPRCECSSPPWFLEPTRAPARRRLTRAARTWRGEARQDSRSRKQQKKIAGERQLVRPTEKSASQSKSSSVAGSHPRGRDQKTNF